VGPFERRRFVVSDHFFGIQIALQAPANGTLRRQLARLLRQQSQDLDVLGQRTLFGMLGNTLREGVDVATLGFWDLQPNGRAEYDDWVRGLEDDAAERWVADTAAVRLDHALVTMLFLLPSRGRSARLVGERCDLPEDRWMQRGTFRTLFATVGELDFASVRAAAAYLTPGNEALAFSRRELEGDGYDYLLPLR
jgi:hypothetical protein